MNDSVFEEGSPEDLRKELKEQKRVNVALSRRLEKQLSRIQRLQRYLVSIRRSGVLDRHPPLNLGFRITPRGRKRGAGTSRIEEIEYSRLYERSDADLPLPANKGLACCEMAEGVYDVIGMDVIGVEQNDLVRIVSDVTATQQINMDFVPVFFTDSEDLNVFRFNAFTYEYFPSRRNMSLYGRGLDWEKYKRARMSYFVRKWNISRMLHFTAQSKRR